MVDLPLPPSPGAVEHVSVDLVNSVVRLPGGSEVDALATPRGATTWLAERGLVAPDADLQAYCQARMIALRDDIRRVFEAAVGGTSVDDGLLERVNAALTAVPSAALLRYSPQEGFTRSLEHPVTRVVEHAMSVIAEDAVGLLVGETSSSLARCDAEPCSRVFLRTHGRRQWCSTRCGDRVRAARSYARKRERVASTPG
ncbi:CGNR zinc finger domain-containing protein [Janibacter melonis]|uniref:CGNR zinc finger domain-containing protein n=1 Tax=Janibacter melonis TaxID=262209 RepID=UPI0019188E6E|nr:CGNR zinc finger domain-containing protein [Janibacter melonis]